MKYYLLRGTVDKIEDRYWSHMTAIEPEVVELTKDEYETDRGIKPVGKSGKDSKNVRQPVAADTVKKDDAQISGENTKKEIIAEILKSGEFTRTELTRKNKQQLLEML